MKEIIKRLKKTMVAWSNDPKMRQSAKLKNKRLHVKQSMNMVERSIVSKGRKVWKVIMNGVDIM